MKDDRGGVGSLDGCDHSKGPALGRMSGGFEDGVKGGFDVSGDKRAAIMEMDAWAQMENVGERVGRAPGFSQIAMEIHLIVALEKAAEQEPVQFLGLRVGGEARIEIGGAGFDQKS